MTSQQFKRKLENAISVIAKCELAFENSGKATSVCSVPSSIEHLRSRKRPAASSPCS